MKNMNKHLMPLMAVGLIAGGGLMATAPVWAQGFAGAGGGDATRPAIVRPFHFFMGLRQVDDHAELLGLSGDELLAREVQGQTLPEILEDLGLTKEDVKVRTEARMDARKDELATRLQGLVDAGTITSEQAASFLERTERHSPMMGHRMGGHR